MKKLLIVFFVAVLAFSSFITVSATENDAELVVTGDFNKDTKILTVHASINNIKPEYGIIIVEYHINYDRSDLALMEANVNMPDLWKPHVESQNAEDLSRRISDGKYAWSVVMAKVKLGIKEDEQLTIDLKFKVKSETDISISFDNVVVATEVPFKYNGKTMYEPTEISVNDATLEFDSRTGDPDFSVDNNDVSKEPTTSKPSNPTNPSNPSTPTTSEEPTTSEPPSVQLPDTSLDTSEPTNSEVDDPVVSQDPSSTESKEPSNSEAPAESDDPITSDNSTDEDEPTTSKDPSSSGNNETDESNDTSNSVSSDIVDTSDVSDEISDDSEDESENEGVIVMPDIEISSNDATAENSSEKNDSVDNKEDHSDMFRTIIWVVVGIICAAIITIVILYVRKSKKVNPDA